MAGPHPPLPTGIPPAAYAAVLEILARSSTPVRRRKLLELLEQRGHRISLAGLNRLLEHARNTGRTTESPDGVRVAAQSP